MNYLRWNYWGLGFRRHVHELKALVLSLKPSFLFLRETKISSSSLDRLRTSLGFSGGFFVDSIGSKGGLALFGIITLSFFEGHIDATVLMDSGNQWCFTGFYGHPSQDKSCDS